MPIKNKQSMNKKIFLLGLLGLTVVCGLYANRTFQSCGYAQTNATSEVTQNTNNIAAAAATFSVIYEYGNGRLSGAA